MLVHDAYINDKLHLKTYLHYVYRKESCKNAHIPNKHLKNSTKFSSLEHQRLVSSPSA